MTVARWAAIVGRSKGGLPAVVDAVVAGLRADGLTVGGVVQRPIPDAGAPERYDLVDLHSGARRVVARLSHQPDMCNWAFEPEAFEQASAWIAAAQADAVVVPIGRLEARGGGHRPTFDRLFAPGGPVVVATLPPNVVARVALDLPDPVAGLELPVTVEQISAFVRAVAAPALG